MPAKLPLPRKFFTCPELDVDSASMLADHAVNGLKTMVELARFQGGPITWTLESDKDGIQNYSGSGTHAPVGAVLTLHVTNVEGTLEDAASLMQSTNPADYTAYCAAFAPDVSDSATLYTLRTPSAAKPREYAAVKWQCFESPTSLVKSRDVCYVEGVCMNCNKYWKMTTPEGRKTRVCYACSSAQATGFRGAKSDVLVDDSLFDSMSGSDHLELGLDRDGSVGLDKDGTIRFLAPRGFTSPFDLEGRQSYHSAGSHHSKA
ncbi:hypothetical protein DYB28_008441 [Aphanomyces astaci]|uniref:Uncharacterized protein n=1 Tax=Aphanomyces astaci TaxID=112090 RepID=A0A9X8DLW3_APHAT|nr:hypothetical protein DYB28_008441 [Aphanomyces astaci]